MFLHLSVQILGVVAPRSLATLPTGNQNPLIMPVVCLLTALLIFALRPRRRQQEEREDMLSDLKKSDFVAIPAGVYRIAWTTPPAEEEVTLCVDERRGLCITVPKDAVRGVVKPGAPSDGKSAGAA